MVTACSTADLCGTVLASQTACTSINPPGPSSPGCTYTPDNLGTTVNEERCYYASDAADSR